MFGNFFKPTPSLSAQDTARRLQEAEPPLVVDVREPGEHADGHIPGCVLMPLGSVTQRLGELPRDREIVVVCRSGARSAMATKAMRDAGLQAHNMEGGMLAWRGPTER
ncbi:MAG: rhodanese-like domain-containing protein [Candidatus Sericytochromatia bacterium]